LDLHEPLPGRWFDALIHCAAQCFAVMQPAHVQRHGFIRPNSIDSGFVAHAAFACMPND